MFCPWLMLGVGGSTPTRSANARVRSAFKFCLNAATAPTNFSYAAQASPRCCRAEATRRQPKHDAEAAGATSTASKYVIRVCAMVPNHMARLR